MRKNFDTRIHWEICRDLTASIIYCAKDNDFTSGGVEKSELIKPIDRKALMESQLIKVLRPWQLQIEEIIKRASNGNDRTIYWIYETTGNVGKSAFTKYCAHWYKTVFINKGKYSDIMNMCFNVGDKLESVIFDLPRNNGNSISYDALESIKNGAIFNNKYETGNLLIAIPHVIVFANEKPDISKLSKDRWCIFEIVDNELIKKNINKIENEEESLVSGEDDL